ncbi:MAG: mechanosensitive ion channel [Prevotella sp.]|nr:mechanosensitive ion channel [Prevotella sp.]
MIDIILKIESLLITWGLAGGENSLNRHAILVLLCIIVAWLSGYAAKRLLIPLVLFLTRKTKVMWDDVILDKQVLNIACNIIPALVISACLPIVFNRYANVEEILSRLTSVYITVNVTRLAIGIVGRFQYIQTDIGKTKKQYLKSFCGVLKIVILFIAVVVVIATLINKNPMTLFAGLGATSAILMLVFKDTIEGLVAGIRLTSNEMVHVGDWITVPGTPVDGTVTDITLTTVKVKQFDNTITTVTPLTLVNSTFQNWKGMQKSEGRRAKRLVYLDVRGICVATDALKERLVERGFFKQEELKGEKINSGLFRTYIEAYLRKRNDINQKMTLMVRQMEATQSGVPIELYFFVLNKEWVAYERTLSEVLEHVYAYANVFDLKIYEQYPEQ